MFLLFWGFKGETLQQLLVNPEAERTLKEGQEYLQRAIEQETIAVQALLRFVPAKRRGNDIVLAGSTSEETSGTILPMLRSQSATGHYRCLADYYDEQHPTPLGLFTIVAQPKQQPADEAERLMSHAICARLAEACAEWLQQRTVCRDDIATNTTALLRVAFGYATCPDHSLKRIVFDLLDAERLLNVTLTDHYSIQPSTAICGLFICHPEARYFSVGRIDEEQLADYCQRRGISVAEGEQLLSKYIVRNNGITV
jgi:5-methyltetrahydrofolate--homocysteine methyltransferase